MCIKNAYHIIRIEKLINFMLAMPSPLRSIIFPDFIFKLSTFWHSQILGSMLVILVNLISEMRISLSLSNLGFIDSWLVKFESISTEKITQQQSNTFCFLSSFSLYIFLISPHIIESFIYIWDRNVTQRGLTRSTQ